MQLGGHRLRRQLGAGPDGAAYLADATDGTTVVVCVLDAARADAQRWQTLTRRLRRAALLNHPGALTIEALALEAAPPFVVVEWLGEASDDSRPPRLTAVALDAAHTVATVLAAAHCLGLSHGALGPEALRRAADGSPRLDFTGVRAGRPGCAVDADFADDVAALGRLLVWMLTGQPGRDAALPPAVGPLLDALLAVDRTDRLTAAEAARRLSELALPLGVDSAPMLDLSHTVHAFGAAAGESALPERLGRFRLLEPLGEGGMGAVFKARDESDGSVVALKVLRPHSGGDDAIRRFRKEARLLREVVSPCVANLLEDNEDAGRNYLVIEYVAGQSLDKLLDSRGRLSEREALAIAADVARGLAEAHARGIVHRDVKPDNVLLPVLGPPVAKLTDFGLARHVVESESLNVTKAGAILGTLLYMSPEQCAGAALDARADVYALGATLYHLLAGRPPFDGASPLALIAQHTKEPPPPLRRFCPEASEGIGKVIEKALSKDPADRYADATGLLSDLERLLRGEPTGLAAHPRRPVCDPRRVRRYEFTWDLQATPGQLWPHVSNTERLNRAVGLSSVQFTDQPSPGASAADGLKPRGRRFGAFRKVGLTIGWEEHPFEWVEGRKLGVLREYHSGPFKWLLSAVEMMPYGSGTRLTHRVEVEPRGVLGRTLAAIEIGRRGRRALERVYRRMDAALQASATSPGAGSPDPFEPPNLLLVPQRDRLDALLDDLVKRGVAAETAERLGDYLAEAPAQAVARLRPLALARTLGLDPDATVTACLHAARAGLLVLLWDVLCPVCRIPTEVKDSLRQLREHERCVACDLDYALDFANSVELVFRVHPEVRPSELATYCVGGPAHSPHVAAQARIAPGERIELELALTEGSYRLRGPQLPYAIDFRVQPGAGATRWDLSLAKGPDAALPRSLRPGGQLLALANDHGTELVVRIERIAPRADALTAARASSLALFRDLFPGEVLSPGQLISMGTVTLLVTDLERAGELYGTLGDTKAFGLIHEHFRLVRDRVAAGGGALVKTVGEGIVAAFPDAAVAVRAALELQGLLDAAEATRGLCLRAGVHCGPALAATLNDHLDYFGTTVRQALVLPALAPGGGLVLTRAVAAEPAVATLLAGRGDLFAADLPGAPGEMLLRLH